MGKRVQRKSNFYGRLKPMIILIMMLTKDCEDEVEGERENLLCFIFPNVISTGWELKTRLHEILLLEGMHA